LKYKQPNFSFALNPHAIQKYQKFLNNLKYLPKN
jgi:hypothetical protein